MKRPILLCLLALLMLAPATAQDDPQPVDLEERVDVDLVLVDTVVLDRKGRTVPGLTRDDFFLSVQGQAQNIDTFDVDCPDGALDDPLVVKPGEHRGAGPSPGQKRRIVIAFDYYHTPLAQRSAGSAMCQLAPSSQLASAAQRYRLGELSPVRTSPSARITPVTSSASRPRRTMERSSNRGGVTTTSTLLWRAFFLPRNHPDLPSSSSTAWYSVLLRGIGPR